MRRTIHLSLREWILLGILMLLMTYAKLSCGRDAPDLIYGYMKTPDGDVVPIGPGD